MMIMGSYDFDGSKVWGWVVGADELISVEIIINGEKVADAEINKPRHDIIKLGITNKINTGFELKIKTNEWDVIEIKIPKDKGYLTSSRQTGLLNPPPLVTNKIGIGVITYNRINYLKKLVESLFKFTSAPFYLIVADDGSSDGTVEWCEEKGIPVVTGENKGIAWNKNRAIYPLINKTDADIIIIMEDDCWPVDKYWLNMWSYCAKTFEHINYAHPELIKNKKTIKFGKGTFDEPYTMNLVTGQCTAVSRNALNQVGYLDSRFKGFGAEHVEWSNRINKVFPVKINKKTHKDLYYQIRCGMLENDAPSYKNEVEIERNRKIKSKITNEPIYRNPWQTQQEEYEFLKEQKKLKEINVCNSISERLKEKNFKVFLHIPKTAGTSFRIGIESTISVDEIAYDYGTTEKITSFFIKNNNDIYNIGLTLATNPYRILVGHFNAKKYLTIFNQEQFIVFFRDPVERVVSDYKHFVRHYNYTSSLSDFITQEQFRNRQSKFIKGLDIEKIGFIGISEMYDESINIFNRKYGFNIPYIITNNARPDMQLKHKITDQERHEIEQLNKLDIDLYNNALKIFEINKAISNSI